MKSRRTTKPTAVPGPKSAGVRGRSGAALGHKIPRAEKSAARREAILAAALDEFSAQGFAAARLDDVARRAGVAKGTIYLHFRDKDSLFQELIRSALGPVVTAIQAAPIAELPLRVIGDRLVDLFVHEVFATRRKDIIRLIVTEGPRFPKLAEFHYREVVEPIMAVLRRAAQRAVDGGEIDNDALVRFPQLFGVSAIVAVIWSGLFERFAPLDVEDFMRAHLQIILGKGRAA